MKMNLLSVGCIDDHDYVQNASNTSKKDYEKLIFETYYLKLTFYYYLLQ